jgi:anti-anti-sigma factor
MTETDAQAQSGPAKELPSFAITLDRDADGVRVIVSGELDLSSAQELDQILDGVAIADGERLLVDLDAVDFMDSTGLAAIVRANGSAEHNGYRLTVRYRAPQVRQLLDVCGMLDYFTFEE